MPIANAPTPLNDLPFLISSKWATLASRKPDQAVRVAIFERLQQHGMKSAENRSVRSNAERQSHYMTAMAKAGAMRMVLSA